MDKPVYFYMIIGPKDTWGSVQYGTPEERTQALERELAKIKESEPEVSLSEDLEIWMIDSVPGEAAEVWRYEC